MFKRIVVGVISLALVALLGGLANAQSLYAFFYSRAAGQDLEINLLNPAATQTNYLINAYDAWGNAVWEETGTLAAKDASFYTISDAIPEADSNWGVIVVASQERLMIGLEYSLKGRLHSVDMIGHALLVPEAGTSYQIGAYHTEVSDAVTSLVVMNPWAVETTGQLVVYGNDGAAIYQAELTLSPYESNAYNLAELAGQSSKTWGVAEVTINQASVVLACKYFKDGLLQVENFAEVWPVTVAPTSSTPGESTPDKED